MVGRQVGAGGGKGPGGAREEGRAQRYRAGGEGRGDISNPCLLECLLTLLVVVLLLVH